MKRLALLALILVAGCGSINTTAQAHTISLAYKAGETYKYALHMVLNYTIGAQGMSIPLDLDMTGKETVKVKSVEASGTADLSIDMSDLSVKTSINGTSSTTTINPSTVDVKIGSDGEIVSVNGNAFGSSGSLPGVSGSGGLVSAILPDKPVKPGDTWTKSYEQANPMGSTGSFKATSDNEYLRDEKVSGINTSVVESKIIANLDLTFDMASLSGQGGNPLFPTGSNASGGLQSMSMNGTVKSDVTSWIDTGARRIVKSHSTGSIDATLNLNMAAGSTTPGLSGPITFKGTQTVDMSPA